MYLGSYANYVLRKDVNMNTIDRHTDEQIEIKTSQGAR